MNREKFVITGIGCILPNTTDNNTMWENLSEGKSQIDFIKNVDTSNFSVKVGAEIVDFDYRSFLPDLSEKFAHKYSKEMLIGMSALANCQKDAKIQKGDIAPEKMGIIESTSRATLNFWSRVYEGNQHGDKDLINGENLIQGLNGTTASMYAIYSDIQGMVTTISCACVGGHHAIHTAINELSCGNEDVMFVLGTEFPICKPVLGIYSDKKTAVLSKECKEPKKALKPYNSERDGFVLGEGSVALCIEKLSHAKKRGAHIYCEVLGAESINEAEHGTRMDLTGKKNAKMLKRLLEKIDKKPEEVSYYCAHGTGTRYNDMTECRIVRLIHGENCPPIGSIKPIYGHMFGGAGVLNVAASAMMIEKQTLCPTINTGVIDEECNLDHVIEGARKTKVNLIISMTHAMGSQSAMVALGEYKDE